MDGVLGEVPNNNSSKNDCVVDVRDYETWPLLSELNSTRKVSSDTSQTDLADQKKSEGDVCKFCHKTFKRLKSHKCKVSDVDTNVRVLPNDQGNSSPEKCLGCQRQFIRITKHLSSSLDCQKHYNLDDLKSKSSDSKRKRKSREAKTEKEKADELIKERQRDKKRRENMNEEETVCTE